MQTPQGARLCGVRCFLVAEERHGQRALPNGNPKIVPKQLLEPINRLFKGA